ncbi:hypothetical protein [Marinicella litoralis]|uniref:Uncharacterized protein n=1 Tax=Marinicella litoralis TaxID=644220 RepID=A0A4V3DIX7_9GAMM|nr:hypothetical protein [Marinicella litoralis]TDR23511.1 hypothetical protein C8D91_0373 [Marinicella litoralis]
MINATHSQHFQLSFDDGRVDSFDSTYSSFNREMCGDAADQWVPLKLESVEVQTLIPLIDAVRFFELAENQVESKLVDKDKGISLTCNPCAKSQLQIKLGDMSNKVFWDCGCARKISPPESIEPLVKGIKAILYQRKEVKSMQKTNCVFF